MDALLKAQRNWKREVLLIFIWLTPWEPWASILACCSEKSERGVKGCSLGLWNTAVCSCDFDKGNLVCQEHCLPFSVLSMFMFNKLLSSCILLPVASHIQTYSIQNRTSIVQNRKVRCREVRACQIRDLPSGLLLSEFDFLVLHCVSVSGPDLPALCCLRITAL